MSENSLRKNNLMNMEKTKLEKKSDKFVQTTTFLQNDKNRKTNVNHVKNRHEISNLTEISYKQDEKKLIEKAYKTDLITYIKVLLEAYKSLPNIMNIIDRLIEKRASSIMPASTIYGSSYFTTYNEINKVIDMSERKDKLLNIYVIIENMLDSLDERDRKIAVLKFIQKCNTEDIAKDFNTTDRTIYRIANKILEKLALYMLNQNWDSQFIKFQIGNNEPWLNDLYRKKKSEEKVNKQRGEKSISKNSL